MPYAKDNRRAGSPDAATIALGAFLGVGIIAAISAIMAFLNLLDGL